MGYVHATIDAGICGFTTEVVARSDDDQHVTFEVASPCEKIQALGAGLPVVDAYQEIGAGSDGAVLTCARRHLTACCAGCIVPPAIYKTMQVAAGLALPRDLHVALARSRV